MWLRDSSNSHWATNQVAIVAGGTSGIGLEAGAALAEAGFATILINGRDEQRGATAKAVIKARAPSCQVLFHQRDASVAGATEEMIAMAGGRVDLFLNAVPGNMPATLFSEFDMTGLNELVKVHLESVFRCSHAVYAQMRSAQSGVIINIASDAAKIPTVGETVHGALMAAIDMFSRTLALEAARFGVRVHVLTPSIVAGTHSQKRMMDGSFSEKLFTRAMKKAALGVVTPSDISPLVVFLASPAAKKMTGQRITINGGIAVD